MSLSVLQILSIGFGATLGALLRHTTGLYFTGITALLLVNGLGSFIIGYISRNQAGFVWLFIGVGFCGALTTFSSFSLAIINLYHQHAWLKLGLCFIATNCISIFCCWLGMIL
jgi:CrcB protein